MSLSPAFDPSSATFDSTSSLVLVRSFFLASVYASISASAASMLAACSADPQFAAEASASFLASSLAALRASVFLIAVFVVSTGFVFFLAALGVAVFLAALVMVAPGRGGIALLYLLHVFGLASIEITKFCNLFYCNYYNYKQITK